MSDFEFTEPWVTIPPLAVAIEGLDRAGRPLDGDGDGVLDVFEAPEPDQYGRFRVHDKDTGHVLTIGLAGLPHGNFAVLDEPASDAATGLPLPPEHNRFSVEPVTSGQEAEKKENSDA